MFGVANVGKNVVDVGKFAVIVVIVELVDIFLDSGFSEPWRKRRGVDFGEPSVDVVQADDDFIIGFAEVNNFFFLVAWDNEKCFEP